MSGKVSAFERLHPVLQYHLVNSLGWRELRELQEASIPPLLGGEHALVTAPTAGGKTEAAFLPLLSRLLAENWAPLSVLYLCPLKALLNDLEGRLLRLASLMGRRVGLWHGDIRAASREGLLREPPDLLLTTPESLEGLLTARAGEASSFLCGVRAVVVDELHAFAGDDRGWHLLALLERLERLAGRTVQRVGLSATVGNPAELLTWFVGSSRGGRCVVATPPSATKEPEVSLDFVGSSENAAELLSRLYRGEKRLIFCDSRARAEELAFALRSRGVETHVSHGSLGLEQRRAAEEAFARGTNCAIVATSTLELGIDVGDLDRVVQIDAPSRVASFLQRLGRSGRREGTRRNLLFLATSDHALLLAAGLTRLWREGFVEPLEPPALPYHILAQQILALVLAGRGLAVGEWREWVGRLPGFASLPAAGVEQLNRYLLEAGWLFADGGVLGLGPEAERRFRGKGFLELLSVFSTTPLFSVFHGRSEIGQVDEASFLAQEEGETVLLLAGRGWRVRAIEWNERVAYVEAVEQVGRSIWPGEGQALSYGLCQAVREVLRGDTPGGALTRRASERLEGLRTEASWLPAEGTPLLRESEKRHRWWTFAGLKANASLSERLRAAGLTVVAKNNLSLALAGESVALPLRDALVALAQDPHPLALQEAPVGARASLKFAFAVPPDLTHQTLRQRWSDPDAVQRVVREPVVGG